MSRVLVADDDDLLGELLRYKLEAAGYSVTIVCDGEAALAQAASGSHDLVILDAMMPVKSGFEVLKDLRAVDSTRSLPVVMLTSRKSQDDVVSALNAGATDYVTKPFIPDELVVRVAAILRSGQRNEPDRSLP